MHSIYMKMRNRQKHKLGQKSKGHAITPNKYTAICGSHQIQEKHGG